MHRRIPGRLVIGMGLLASAAGVHAQPPQVRPQETIIASDAVASDIFGGAVAMADGTLVVGARGVDTVGTNAGGAYVHAWSGTAWTQVQKVTVAGSMAGDEFGGGAAVSGVRFAIGGPRAETVAGPNAGRVAIFTFNGVSWIESATVTPSGGGQVGAAFGDCVALDGGVLVTGSPLHDMALRDEGVVHVHRFDAKSSQWLLEQVLEAPDAGENDRFGSSVAIDGDRIAVGVPRDDDAGIDGGAVWIFERIDGQWTATDKLVRSSKDWQSGFGVSLAIDGDVVAVGSDRDDRFGVDDGAVWIFEQDPVDGWLESAVLGAPGMAARRELGISVDLDGDRLVAGMPVDDEGGMDVGAAVTFRRGAKGWTTEAVLRPDGAEELSLVGMSVGMADGRVVAGAPLWGGTSEPLGAVLALDLSIDCDADGRPDVVAIAAGEVEDCNGNGVPDGCDISSGDEDDIDGNGIPDSCFFDCDGNGLDDATEIEAEPNLDSNGNGTLDRCECLADLFVDGEVNGADLGVFLAYAGACGDGTGNPNCISDFNGDGLVNGFDLGLILAAWGPCAP